MNRYLAAFIVIIVAVVAFVYLPTPLDWIVGLLFLVLAVAVALGELPKGRTGRL